MTTAIPLFINGDDRAKLKMLQRSLEPFRSTRNSLPLQYAQTLIAVMIEEDMTTNEIAEATRIAPAMVSRQLADCGRINRYHAEGFGLVETQEDVMDRRFHRTGLTARGRGLARDVLTAMGARS
jgi:DNA-binding MarR family transcriptional regulator